MATDDSPTTAQRAAAGTAVDAQLFKDIVPLIFFVFAVADVYFLILFLFSLNNKCDQPLVWWLLGAILLSLPASFAIERIKKIQGFRYAFYTESCFTMIAFLWMSLGTVEVLWWTVFVCCTIFWCLAAGMIFSLILITIINMTVSGGKNPSV